MTPEEAAALLLESRLAHDGLLRPRGASEVARVIAELDLLDLHAYVVVVPASEDLRDWRRLWSMLELDPATDLLLLFAERRWEGRGWGLPTRVIADRLDDSETALRVNYANGLVEALRSLAHATGRTGSPSSGLTPAAGAEDIAPNDTDQPAAASGGLGIAAIGGSLVVVGALIAWVVARRSRRAAEVRRRFTDTLASVERAYADLVLSAEELEPQVAAQLQLEASDLKVRLDALTEGVRGDPVRMDDPVLLGRIEQMDSEIAALDSRVRQQRAKRRM